VLGQRGIKTVARNQLYPRALLKIEARRRELGFSQLALGSHPAVQIHQLFISEIERGLAIPTPDQLLRLSRVLNVPPDELLKPVTITRAEAVEQRS